MHPLLGGLVTLWVSLALHFGITRHVEAWLLTKVLRIVQELQLSVCLVT